MGNTEWPRNRRVAMIGVDAADLDFIEANISSLPNFRHALDTGIKRKLHSTAGALTGSVWPTFYAGKPPGEHGIYHHLQWDSSKMQLRRVSEEWLYCEPFWYDLERRGLRVIAIDVPMTFRPRLNRGIEVITWGSHDELTPFAAHPAELGRNILRRFGSHPMGHEIPVRHSLGELEKIRRNLIKGAQLKAQLGEWLATEPWDFFLIVFGECHRGGHILWPGNSVSSTALLDVYFAVDEAFGSLLKAFGHGATVYLFALHGMGANTSQEHFAPRVIDLVNRLFIHGQNGVTLAPRRNTLVPWLREHIPAGLQNAIARSVPTAARDAVVNRSIVDGHDWSRTPGFAVLADANAYLRFNLAQRERAGMLEPGSDAQTRYLELLLRCFRSFRLDSGQPLVQDVLFSETHFPGIRSQHLPDIILTWPQESPASVIRSDEFGIMRAELATGRGGNHRPNGFCIEMRDGVQQPGTADAISLWELGGLVTRGLTG